MFEAWEWMSMPFDVCTCVLLLTVYQEFKEMLEEARQAEITKNECAAMAWDMLINLARDDEDFRLGESAAPSSASTDPATAAAPAAAPPVLSFEGVPTTIEHVVLLARGPMTPAEIQAEVIFDVGLVPKFASGDWPEILAAEFCSMAVYNEYGEASPIQTLVMFCIEDLFAVNVLFSYVHISHVFGPKHV